mgnify:CR=1 FL=1
MSFTAFDINDGAFRLFNSSAENVFDSRLQTQNIFLQGVADVPGRQTTPAPGGGVILNPSYTISVALGKTMAAAPYVRSFSRRLNAVNASLEKPPNRVYPPWLAFNSAFAWLTASAGHYTNVDTTTLYIGNLDAYDVTNPPWNGVRRVWYSAFDNLVG